MRISKFLKKQTFLTSDSFCRLKPLVLKGFNVRSLTDSVRNRQKVKNFLTVSDSFLPVFSAETRMRVGKVYLSEMTESKMRVFGQKMTICKFFSPEPAYKGQVHKNNQSI